MLTTPMTTSETGILLIKGFEGFSPIPYKDAAGFPTIGYGHKILPTETLSRLDEAAAEALLRTDVASKADGPINTLARGPLNQNQFDALASFTFNEGEGHLARSTLLRLLNQEEYDEAAGQFVRWIFVGGEISEDLRKRRATEAALFRRPIDA